MGSQPPHVIFLGNPGAGKSTILNTLSKSDAFASGPSIGGGLTKTCQTVTTPTYTLCDTPGLDDPLSRAAAASALSTLLSSARAVKLIFVTTLEGAVVRASDVATVHVVLMALRQAGAGITTGFTICVNKCDADELARLRTHARRADIAAQFAYAGCEPVVHALPRETEAAEAVNARLSLRGERQLWDMVGETPIVRLVVGVPVTVDGMAFPQLLREMRDMVQRQQEALRRQRAENQMLASSRWRRQLPRVVFYVFQVVGVATAAVAVMSLPGLLKQVWTVVFKRQRGVAEILEEG